MSRTNATRIPPAIWEEDQHIWQRFTQMVPQEMSGTIVRFYYRRCFCNTEQRTKLERTHALIQVGDRQVKVPYRHLK